MTPAQVAVTLAGALLAVGVNAWFFAPARLRKRDRTAGPTLVMPAEGPQVVRITVRDGYDPGVIEVRAGLPVRLLFRREEVAGCSDTVLIPEWGIVRRLPAYQETAVEFTPKKPGQYPFTCGMNMMRGMIVVRA